MYLACSSAVFALSVTKLLCIFNAQYSCQKYQGNKSGIEESLRYHYRIDKYTT